MNAPRPVEGERLGARVLRLDARGCVVRLDEERDGLKGDRRTLFCGVRGRIHMKDRTGQKSPLAVGDVIDVVHTVEDRGVVTGVHPRRSTLSRPAVGRGHVEHVMVANVDQVAVVSSAAAPPFNGGLVDRILAVVAFSDLDGLLVVNKMDLAEEPPAQLATYRALGYPVVETSASEGTGLDDLRRALEGRQSVVCGHSGVGKSSLLNALQPGLGLLVGDVNVVTTRGRHTTTGAAWIPFGEDGALVDTAGVREFGLFGIPRRDLPWLFRDLAAVAPGCRYPDCLHREEPACAVQRAVEEGRIARFRYESYLRILEDL